MVAITSITQLEQIIRQYAEILNQQITVDAIYLFGSYAKGTADQDSDIDLIVVSKDWKGNIIEDTMLLMRARRKVDLRIEPHPTLPEELENNPFILSLKPDMRKVV
ncbi:MAG: nucleotidyltransferase domain-containing protein [Candidatus Cloacimonetes bacterium]|nr:nucleotidyltransferase domain-containing protein [Candidatus Cloacimonadota bacterium]